ncbi:hypothetical protein ACIRVK_40725 [Streptomyces sp. NPDC101152]
MGPGRGCGRGPLAYGNDGTAPADGATLTAAGLDDFSDAAFNLVREV